VEAGVTKPISLISLTLIVMLGLWGCGDDSTEPPPPPSGPEYRDLSEEWHVLNNLELSWDDMNLSRYQELFDPDNFVFFPNPDDVGKNGVPNQWGYAEEIQSAANMFSQAGGREDNPVVHIDVTLYDIETAQWESVESVDFPGETLRQTVVHYTLRIETVGEVTYVTPEDLPRSRFVVRHIEGKWKLVDWYDIGGGSLSRLRADAVDRRALDEDEGSFPPVRKRYR
jgi:hypothetical protein